MSNALLKTVRGSARIKLAAAIADATKARDAVTAAEVAVDAARDRQGDAEAALGKLREASTDAGDPDADRTEVPHEHDRRREQLQPHAVQTLQGGTERGDLPVIYAMLTPTGRLNRPYAQPCDNVAVKMSGKKIDTSAEEADHSYVSTVAHKSQLETEGAFFRQPIGSSAREKR